MADDLDDVPAAEDAGPAETVTENAASPRAVRSKKREVERREREEMAFLSRCLVDPIGRRLFWGWLQAAHTFETQFAMGPTGFPDGNATWFQAGRKAMGEQIFLTLVRADPAAALLMMQEHDERLPKPKKDETDG